MSGRRVIVCQFIEIKGMYKNVGVIELYNERKEKVIEKILNRETNVLKNQFGFIPERLTMKLIFYLRQLTEKYRKKKSNLAKTIAIDL